ncbi:MAG TPA: acylneuraminate cytidylyltransferase family protein [Tepidisphaeraceae bacterium]|jgi:CMP-N-acetylneuraminic acid synthetase|nr:acylneuraminate cytidylyltransferase family protein [Tepidisphaeraceae bacterium]
MQTLGVILARAGSIGLQNKHLLPLLGRPVISYTFDHARAARRLDRVVVSSDCPRILDLARRNGFDTVRRPAHLATSDASVQDTMIHAMRAVEADESFQSDALVVLYGNVPVRPVGVIDHAIELLEQSDCDSVRSFCPVGKWHPAWMSKLDGDHVTALRPGSIHRRQDLEPLHLHDGGVVAVSRKSMLLGEEHPEDPHAFFGSDRRAIQTAMGETVEIDQQRDFYWAEAVLRAQSQSMRLAS